MSDEIGEKFVVGTYEEDENGDLVSTDVEYESEEAWLETLDPWELSGVEGDRAKNELWCRKCYAALPPTGAAAVRHVGWHEELEHRLRGR